MGVIVSLCSQENWFRARSLISPASREDFPLILLHLWRLVATLWISPKHHIIWLILLWRLFLSVMNPIYVLFPLLLSRHLLYLQMPSKFMVWGHVMLHLLFWGQQYCASSCLSLNWQISSVVRLLWGQY